MGDLTRSIVVQGMILTIGTHIRPIVVLSSNIKIDTSSTDGESAENAFIIREE